ncbi:hypothetical protein DQ04_08971020 [Trypanosoma grayi]|uniref:hypothetical protein n=1 Tax=Trypanosoma grayi TaxID=71804 RepID=UPI0004F45F79|nr:hypothetical protein DQ04_08971020 [Trypanosoma grayi]KEG07728.1 hypothetical protein DQ04_08971020 [Trypanosoma grayi]
MPEGEEEDASSRFSYGELHERLSKIGRLARSRETPESRRSALAEAQRDMSELLRRLRHQCRFSESPSARVVEAQALMHQAVLFREASDVLGEAQAYDDASTLWFRVERERRLLNFPT